MLQPPHTHTFHIAGETFTLTEYQTRGSESRIQQTYALALNPAPLPLEMYDGGNLWVEAVAKECLSHAPVQYWRARQPGEAPSRFDPDKVITLEAFSRLTWPLFRKEVNAFLADLPQPVQPLDAPARNGVSADAEPVAAAQALSPLLAGRAG